MDVTTSGTGFLLSDCDLSDSLPDPLPDPLPDYLTSTGSSPAYSDISLSPTEHLRVSPDYISEITSTNLEDVFESQPFNPRSKLKRDQTKPHEEGKVSSLPLCEIRYQFRLSTKYFSQINRCEMDLKQCEIFLSDML
jgi:hypothetical protein